MKVAARVAFSVVFCSLFSFVAAHAQDLNQGISPSSPPPDAEPASPSSHHHRDYGVLFEGGYGFASVNPSSMNHALSDFTWQNGVVAPGTFSNLQYFDFAAGYRIFSWAYLNLRYEQMQQSMLPVVITSTTYSVTNVFYYYPLYLLLDAYVYRYESFFVTAVGGVGYALKYELHQTENPGEDVTWRGNPTAYRLGGSVGFSFADNFDLVADIVYESVSSKLKAAKTYGTTFQGQPITGGQYFTDQGSGAAVNADLSGLRYGLDVRIRF